MCKCEHLRDYLVLPLCFMGKVYPQRASQGALVVKNLYVNARDIRDVGLIPGPGRSPGGGHGNPLLAWTSILAWTIPWTEKPGGLWSTGSQIVGHD